jgi:hypothetical protein
LQESESLLWNSSLLRGEGRFPWRGGERRRTSATMLQSNPSLPSAAQQLETWQVCCPHPTALVPSVPSLASSSSRPLGACFSTPASSDSDRRGNAEHKTAEPRCGTKMVGCSPMFPPTTTSTTLQRHLLHESVVRWGSRQQRSRRTIMGSVGDACPSRMLAQKDAISRCVLRLRGSSCRVNREASRWSKARQPEARATASANIKGGSDVAQPRVVLCCPGNTSPAQPYPILSPSPRALTPHHDRILSQHSLAGGYEAYIPSPSDPEQRTKSPA